MFSSESSPSRGFTWKNQALFSLKDKYKKINCRLLQLLSGALGLRRGNEEEHNKTIGGGRGIRRWDYVNKPADVRLFFHYSEVLKREKTNENNFP